MILPAAALPSPAFALPGGAAATAPGDELEGADFGALLAMQGLNAMPQDEASPAGTAITTEADPAAIPASPGKMLPPLLPVEPDDAPIGQTARTPLLAVPVRISGPALPTSSKPAKGRAASAQTIERPVETVAAEPGESPGTAPDLPGPLASAAAPIATAPPVATAPAQALPLESAVRNQGSVSNSCASERGGLASTCTANPRNALPSRSAEPTRVQDHADPAPPSPQATPVAAAAAQPRPAEEVRIALALPRAAAASEVAGEAKAVRSERSAAVPSETGEALQPASTPPPSAPLPLVQAAPQIRPHDFAALIDRLSAAREAVQPQTVSVTVSHQDFGPVRIHFRPEDAGVSVAMSSADPDFARAAAAAPAPILPINSATEASFGQSRGDTATGQPGAQTGGSQSRGSFTGQREGHGQPQANPSPRGQQQRPAPRPGIFA